MMTTRLSSSPPAPVKVVSIPFRLGHSLRRAYRTAVPDSLAIVRRDGWRALLRQRGWKFFAAIVALYLVRDVVIYVLVPICIARRLF